MATPTDPTPLARPSTVARRVDAVDAVLPQTQCRRCAYADCRAYAEAIVTESAPINRCPPGGSAGIARLAFLTGRVPVPLDPACGIEGPPRLARIDEAACIGCRVCLAACPVDAIFGGRRSMHVVIAAACTGCELCIPACPVDCIAMVDAAEAPAAAGGDDGSAERSSTARERYRLHRERYDRLARARSARLQTTHVEPVAEAAVPAPGASEAPIPSPRSLVEAALARARTRGGGGGR